MNVCLLFLVLCGGGALGVAAWTFTRAPVPVVPASDADIVSLVPAIAFMGPRERLAFRLINREAVDTFYRANAATRKDCDVKCEDDGGAMARMREDQAAVRLADRRKEDPVRFRRRWRALVLGRGNSADYERYVSAGADANLPVVMGGRTPLLEAVDRDLVQGATALLERGGAIFCVEGNSSSNPWCSVRSPEMVRLLVRFDELKMWLNAVVDNTGATPLDIAQQCDVIRAMKAAGARGRDRGWFGRG